MNVRALLGPALALVWFVSACTDTELPVQPKTIGPARFGIVPPNLVAAAFPIGSYLSPSNTMGLPTYSDSTIVEVRLTGSIRVTSAPNTNVQPYTGPLDGSGIFVYGAWYACYANVSFSWPASQRSGPSPCYGPPDSTRISSVWADTILASGQGTVTRGQGVPQWTGDCNNTQCHTYSGGPQYVSVTPLIATLGLTAYPDSIMAGSKVVFYPGVTPLSMKNITVPLKILSWQWAADGGGSGQTVACAQPVNPCIVSVMEAGTMQLTALVNGAELSHSASVLIRPLAAPCPAPVLRNHPNITDDYYTVNPPIHNDPHTGRDFAEDQGTPFYAPRSGIVREVVNRSSTGWRVIVESTDGSNVYSFFFHLVSQPPVVKNQQVAAGDLLGYTGNTGISTNPHLHFEEHINNGNIWDPITGKDIRTNLVQPCTF
jgi:hypothetical protein